MKILKGIYLFFCLVTLAVLIYFGFSLYSERCSQVDEYKEESIIGVAIANNNDVVLDKNCDVTKDVEVPVLEPVLEPEIEKDTPLGSEAIDNLEESEFNVNPIFEIQGRYKVCADALNVRSGPDTSYTIIGKLYRGNLIIPEGLTDNGWYEITYDELVGYVSGEYVDHFVPTVNEDGLTNDPEDFLVIINSKNNTLNVYFQNSLLYSYDCATGKKSTPTPEGKFTIVNKIKNPSYHEIKGGASNNPLGKRWMGLSVPGTSGGKYGIHGNVNEDSIGTHASQGCVRMHNDEVESLFEVLPKETTVIIMNTDESDKYIASQYDIIIN